MTEQLTIPGVPTPTRNPVRRDREAYNAECALRWHSDCLRNARRNWNVFEAHYTELVEIIRPYLRDNSVKDIHDKSLNPQGTLTAWLWVNSDAHPWLWDFCEHYQKCHLRRGLIAYCKQVIGEIQSSEGTHND
ncbi:hypothetical protein Ga0100231_023890 [Opitutaceae bacterium TAV4]|nr:hypothetical protein Ga0100231_023890 [Opitutaceae bacterium TAV4]RRK00754.1 hypothetical protein Ga0100230_023465 [Opitutaceae bacterium TAV3]